MYTCINIWITWSVTSEDSEGFFKLKDTGIKNKCNKTLYKKLPSKCKTS